MRKQAAWRQQGADRNAEDGLRGEGLLRQLAEDVGGSCQAEDGGHGPQHWDGAHSEVGDDLQLTARVAR